jgi:hypothetical protein
LKFVSSYINFLQSSSYLNFFLLPQKKINFGGNFSAVIFVEMISEQPA